MRKALLGCLLFFFALPFAQGAEVIGVCPDTGVMTVRLRMRPGVAGDQGGHGLRRIQAGAFREPANAERAFNTLRNAGLSPIFEQHMGYTRVALPGIDARHIPYLLDMMRGIGFGGTIWIREETDALHRIQVGAFREPANAERAFSTLRNAGLNPIFENHLGYRRVALAGIGARHISSVLNIIYRSGFSAVWLREEPGTDEAPVAFDEDLTGEDLAGAARPHPRAAESIGQMEPPIPQRFPDGRHAISEKWVLEPGSRFESFEFNQDGNFIVVERQGEESPLVHFGEYAMLPEYDLIDMIGFGILSIESRDGAAISFSFAPIDEPEAQMSFAAAREAPMERTPETDLFARTWMVVDSNVDDSIGTVFLFSINGTYLVSRPDGTSITSQWRWRDGSYEEFEYSHDNWRSYGRATIRAMEPEFLAFDDPGFVSQIEGFSTANAGWFFELAPAADF